MEFVTGIEWRDEILVEPLKIEDGCLVVPEGPGLGVALNMDGVEKHRWRVGDPLLTDRRVPAVAPVVARTIPARFGAPSFDRIQEIAPVMFDVLIRNASIIDGTGAAAYSWAMSGSKVTRLPPSAARPAPSGWKSTGPG